MNTYTLTRSEYDSLMLESDNSKYISLSAWHCVMGNADPKLCDDVEGIDDEFLVLYNLVKCMSVPKMTPEQFSQYQKCLDEIKKLQDLCGTTMMDSIQDMMTNDQQDIAWAHPAIDALQV